MIPNTEPDPTDEAILSNLLPAPDEAAGVELALPLSQGAPILLAPTVPGQGRVTF